MTQTITLAPIIDAKGNIRIPGRAGLIIDVPFQLADGSPDTSAANRDLRFEGDGIAARQLEQGVTADIRRIVITQADSLKIGLSANGKYYNLFDYTENVLAPIPLMFGIIYTFGYNKAPTA